MVSEKRSCNIGSIILSTDAASEKRTAYKKLSSSMGFQYVNSKKMWILSLANSSHWTPVWLNSDGFANELEKLQMKLKRKSASLEDFKKI